MNQIDVAGALALIDGAGGSIFSVTFIKRSTNEVRKMVCRKGVHSHLMGGEASYNPAEHKLVSVFDMANKGYRSIPIEGLLKIKIGGTEYEIKHTIQEVKTDEIPA